MKDTSREENGSSKVDRIPNSSFTRSHSIPSGTVPPGGMEVNRMEEMNRVNIPPSCHYIYPASLQSISSIARFMSVRILYLGLPYTLTLTEVSEVRWGP